jgi:L-rhamnose-H+ transport protein
MVRLAVGGFIVNAAYCGYLLVCNRSWSSFGAKEPLRNGLLSVVMGGMWMGGVVIYGVAVTELGSRGPSIGWALIQSTAILAGNLMGLMANEWKDAGTRFRSRMTVGLALLFAGIALVSAAAFA